MEEIEQITKGKIGTFLNHILKGAIILLPVVLLVVVIVMAFRFIVRILTPISMILSASNEPPWFLHILSFFVLVAILYGAGLFISYQKGSYYFERFEKSYLSKIPLYSTIRDTVQQFSGVKDTPFKQVVLVDAFGTGTMMVGFVTQKLPNELFTVFVPTAPNPTNGFIFHMHKDSMTFLDIKPDRAMRTVLGMGTGSKHLFENKDHSLITEEIQKAAEKTKKV